MPNSQARSQALGAIRLPYANGPRGQRAMRSRQTGDHGWVHNKILAFRKQPTTGRGTACRAPTTDGQLPGNCYEPTIDADLFSRRQLFIVVTESHRTQAPCAGRDTVLQGKEELMAQAPAITTVFVDLGNVLLTDSWGPAMRQKALEHFSFDFAEVADRSRLTFEGYEEGDISLEEYLDWVVFYQERSFSRKAIIDFMLAQSQPHPDMLDLMRAVKARYGIKFVIVT